MSNENRRIVVTGGRGFIGVNLIRKLEDAQSVRVVDSLQRSSPTGWKNGQAEFIQCDIRNLSDLTEAFLDADSVVHLAAFGSVIESIKDPGENFDVNALGTLNVLRAAVSANVSRVVFASTGGALIGDAPPPVNELSLPKPISPYGASKLCGEAYCSAYAKSFGLTAVCTRFGNVYGPHSLHKKGAVTTFIKAVLNNEPIRIYGDGSASRDYIYVDDLCNGIYSSLTANVAPGEVFHLASGHETSVLELAKIVCEIAGKPDHPIEFFPARRGEVDRNFANAEKAKQTLGFEPKESLTDGLKKTWSWFVEEISSGNENSTE